MVPSARCYFYFPELAQSQTYPTFSASSALIRRKAAFGARSASFGKASAKPVWKSSATPATLGVILFDRDTSGFQLLSNSALDGFYEAVLNVGSCESQGKTVVGCFNSIPMGTPSPLKLGDAARETFCGVRGAWIPTRDFRGREFLELRRGLAGDGWLPTLTSSMARNVQLAFGWMTLFDELLQY